MLPPHCGPTKLMIEEIVLELGSLYFEILFPPSAEYAFRFVTPPDVLRFLTALTWTVDHLHCAPSVAVVAAGTLPKRRSRRLNSARAASRSVASKSDHVRSVNRSSA